METESEGSESEDETFTETFKFAKNIVNPMEVINSIQLSSKQPINFLKTIEKDTGTECYLDEATRQIHISADTEESAKMALERFKVLQFAYKRRRRPKLTLVCIHPNPANPQPFSLYFASLERYRYRESVYLHGVRVVPFYVLLPVFQDPSGKFLPPADLLPPAQHQQQQQHQQQRRLSQQQPYKQQAMASSRAGPSTRPAPPQLYQQQQQNQRHPQGYGAAPPASPSHGRQSAMSTTSTDTTLYDTDSNDASVPTWGGNRIQAPSSNHAYSPAAERWETTASPNLSTSDFPGLPGKPTKPTVHQGKPQQRRVIRITPQKSSNGASNTSVSEQCRQYNYHNAKQVLTEALETARCIKGDIRFGAKYGKVLWSNIPQDSLKRIWQKEDIKDLAMKEMGITPVFSNVTTADYDTNERLENSLPDFYSRTACFEIHAQARNQPHVPYQPVVMTVNPGAVGLQKVVVRSDCIAEIDWVNLESKFDFQMYLHADELGRVDVKPYNTFEKKLSVNIQNRHMTYENVPDFLQVTDIYFKETKKLRLHFPFVAEITRVEQLPLISDPNTTYGVEKILAATGDGAVWYDCQVFYTSHNEHFKHNQHLSVGTLAPWTVEDILGPDRRTPGSEIKDPLEDYIACLLIILANHAANEAANAQ
ncbi:hypothetical protein BC940DRAFT_326170 [Gongronella butleri]|nr:hypothetical protein BC940DRAFT_326170 [Gongronella butleri]